MLDDLEKHLAVATAVVAFITLLGSTWARVAAWSERRSIKAKFQDEIGLAERRIAFLDTWLKVQEAVCTAERFEQVKQETARELDDLRNKLADSLRLADQRKDKVHARKSMQRMFLLFLPHNLGGWICHLAFYVLVLFVLLLVITPPSEGGNWVDWVTESLWAVIVFAIPILVVRSLAIRFYRKHD